MGFNKIDKIINNLSKKIFFTISTIVQFAVAFSLIYVSLQLFIDYGDANKKVVNSFGKQTLYSIQSNEDYSNKLYKEESINDYRNFYDYLNENYRVINAIDDNLFTTGYNNIENFIIPNSPSILIGDEKNYILNGLRVNDNYLEDFNIQLAEGRFFNKEEYRLNDINAPIPLILGSDYSEIFNLNDKIYFYDYYNDSKRNGIIVGFLKAGQFNIRKPIAIENVVSIDKTILIPNQPIIESRLIDNNIKKINFANVKLYQDITSSYLSNLSNSDILTIREKSDELKFLDINVFNMNDSIQSFKDIFKQQQVFYIAIFTLIILITSIGTITNIVNSINDRKREFGIYFALGATRKYIAHLVLYEILILSFSGALLSITVIKN
ncbi:MAG: ABC transporter permease, partial [Cetobacterium sp.]